MVAVLESVETLLEEGFEPERTVLICLGYNEELMDDEHSAARKIVKTLQGRGIELECVLDEGGAMPELNVPLVLDRLLVGVGVGEKGYCDFELRVSAKGGHSSAPPKHSAVGELSKAIVRLEDHQFPARITPELRRIVDTVARNMKYPARLVGSNLKFLLPALKPAITAVPAAASLVRTTTAVTMTSGSPQANVMPQKAAATANFRIMPGSCIADVEAHIRKAVKNKNVAVRLLGGNEPSCVSPVDTPSFRAIAEICRAQNGKAMIVPFVVMGGTDARYYEPLTNQIYRFSPFVLPPALLMLAHGTNERVPLESLPGAVAFFKKYIRRMAG